ncbi:diguanylate phosphodiesterase, partial [Streptomyces varsoviensis]
LRVTRRLPQPGGGALWAEIVVAPLPDSCNALLSVADISERYDLRARLRHLQMHDPVTRLPNRGLFFERLSMALESATYELGGSGRIGLCYLDLDGFKAVNDTLGHAVGDELLVAVAERLRACATAPGELVARLGGDEFVGLVTGATASADVTALARRMLRALADPVHLEGRELSVRASIGVVGGKTGTAGSRGAAEVLRSADITMYRAKAAGGNRYELADAACDARAIARHSLTNCLPAALDNGEFFIEYQPLVRLR